MGRQARKRKHCKTNGGKTTLRQVYFRRDIDQVHDDLAKGIPPPRTNPDDERQYCCIECSRFFVDERSLTQHQRTKDHKRRLKELLEKPYTAEDALMGAGKGLPRAGYDEPAPSTDKEMSGN
ncbi:putative bud site selection protein 20 [Blattamonas nauphoetae]|uniref:Bud site selection protein 20 n=1 Tax=Blattamonas nauphoetae TaxID=2049346 RepID=A0ABQ9YBY5_9EUKA|nr:putative bud site selection protein 20 [Blattamonas nauphoetae]